jgi:hypothetical protein
MREETLFQQADNTREAGGATSSRDDDFTFTASGDGYFIRGFGESGQLSSYKGLDVIQRLLKTPGEPVSMLDLIGADDRMRADRRSTQPVLDDRTKRELREKMAELTAEWNQAKLDNDQATLDRTGSEIEQLKRLAANAIGRGGRNRDMNNPFNTLRVRLRGQLNTAYKAMRSANPPLKSIADHLDAAIKSEGTAFIYRPGQLNLKWRISLERPTT